MTTVAQIISRALRIGRVLDPNEAVESADFETACVALNAMMRRWEANGISCGWQPVFNPDTDLPAPEEAEEAIAYNLWLKLRPEYGQTLEPDVAQQAAMSLAELRRDVFSANPLTLTLNMPCRVKWNIYTDSPY